MSIHQGVSIFVFQALSDMRRQQQSVAVLVTLCVVVVVLALGGRIQQVESHKDQPLSGIAIHETTFHLNDKAHVKASPTLLGSNVIITIQILS